MAAKLQVAVLGIGRFGAAAALEFMRLGHEVLVVDSNERAIQQIADEVTHAAHADITDPDALKQLGLETFDIAVIATAESLEVSILATVHLAALGVKQIVAKASDELHGSILERVGAHQVVYPEHETGVRLAHGFGAGVLDYLDVVPGYGLARVEVATTLAGRTLGDAGIEAIYKLTVVGVAHSNRVVLHPPLSESLRAGDVLIVAGLDEDLARFGKTADQT